MKDVAAVLAHKVVEVGVVDLLTETATNFVAHGSAYNTADEVDIFISALAGVRKYFRLED